MKSIMDMKREAANTASHCPGCGWEPKPQNISRAESYGEEYYSVKCPECGRWQYEHHGREWIKLTAPGEDNPTVSRS